MKLVKGRTLAALLAERPGPETDLPRFLSIFEQVCQTVAYAHARRVIHRDLKPANVMVGSFGEVQVMDWGLAKVLPEGGIADEARAAGQWQETVIMTVRSGPAGSGGESQAGSVLGTPAYMAPEQARGEIERVDERADVFGLGAILCEILTGRPPFVGLDAGRDPRQGGAGRPGRRLGPARCLRGRRRADRSGPRLPGRRAGATAAECGRGGAADDGLPGGGAGAATGGRAGAGRGAGPGRGGAEAAAGDRGAGGIGAGDLVVLGGGGWAYLARQRVERARRCSIEAVERGRSPVQRSQAGRRRPGAVGRRPRSGHAAERLLADAPDTDDAERT